MSNGTDSRSALIGRHTATILFCDIRGFTALFDQRDPLEALEFANSVLGVLGAVVEKCGGTIDKFTGDGFLAHFGIINESVVFDCPAFAACRCAIEMRSALAGINKSRYTKDQTVITTGIGIHSGEVAAGYITATHKSEFTILGSAVNIAARIEGLTKFFSVDCLISDATEALVKDQFMLQAMPQKSLRGIEANIKTSWLLPMNV